MATAGAEVRLVDATDAASVATALQGIQAVVNCVAGDANTIVAAAKGLFGSAGLAHPRPRIVHLSTMSVYGTAIGVMDEETAPLLGDLGPYSAAKIQAEQLAATYPGVVILRPGCVFGPDSPQWSTRIARLLQARRLGDLGAAGDGYCNLVDVQDVVTAVIRALENLTVDGRTYNLSVNTQPRWNEFLTRYAVALGAVPVQRITRRWLRLEGKLIAPPLKVVEIAANRLRLSSPPPIPPSLLRLMAQDIRLDTRRAQSELNLRCKDLDVMINETSRWFLQSVGA